MSQEKIMIREHSREFTLFRAATWQMILNKIIISMVGDGADEAVGLYNGDLIRMYYEPESMKKLFAGVGMIFQDKKFLNDKIDEFYFLFEKLEPYLKLKKVPEDMKELKMIYDWYVPYWSIWAMVFILPRVPNIDQEAKDIALKARERTQEYNEAFDDILRAFLKNNYPDLVNDARFILPEEFWNEKLGTDELKEKINKRKKGFVIYKEKFLVGSVDKILSDLGIRLEEGGDIKNDAKEIKGQAAQVGKAKGKVKVVLLLEELEKVEDGDILVATMTMPKYLPAMKKAAAFVTDEGGVTCHAAIIAREMKKPCVIDTKIATQVLKDGMEVEVDADNGVVKLINN